MSLADFLLSPLPRSWDHAVIIHSPVNVPSREPRTPGQSALVLPQNSVAGLVFHFVTRKVHLLNKILCFLIAVVSLLKAFAALSSFLLLLFSFGCLTCISFFFLYFLLHFFFFFFLTPILVYKRSDPWLFSHVPALCLGPCSLSSSHTRFLSEYWLC